MFDIKIYSNVDEIEVESGDQYVVFMTEEYLDHLEQLRSRFINTQMCGAIVPHLILGNQLVPTAISVLRFQRRNSFVKLVDMHEAVTGIDVSGTNMLLLFVDGLSSHLEPFVSSVNAIIGNQIAVMGSGVGCKDLQQRAVVFDQEGIYKDHALVIGTDFKLTAGVRHGWKSLYGPLVVTKVQNNIVYEINGEKAFDVYKRALKISENIEITPECFFDVAKSYPLGIASFSGNEFIIRDPIAANDDGSMTIVSSVNEFDSLYIMKGENETLINSSCELSKEVFSRTDSPVALMFDCISRVLFLEDEFEREIEAVFRCSGFDSLNLYGMTSIGEISNQGYNEIKVFNKTTLLGSINAGRI